MPLNFSFEYGERTIGTVCKYIYDIRDEELQNKHTLSYWCFNNVVFMDTKGAIIFSVQILQFLALGYHQIIMKSQILEIW